MFKKCLRNGFRQFTIASNGSSINCKNLYCSFPGPRGLPGFGDIIGLMKSGGQIHQYFEEIHKVYGPVCKTKIGPGFSMVLLSHPDDIKTLMRNETEYPQRIQFDSWIAHRSLRERPLGILLSDGETWQKHRSALNKHLLRPQVIAKHTGAVNNLAQSLMILLDQKLDNDGNMQNMQSLLFAYALEVASTVMFGRNLGCLEDNPPEIATEFIQAIKKIQNDTINLMIFPLAVAQKLNLKMWQNLVSNLDIIFTLGEKLIAPVMESACERLSSPREASLIGSMLACRNFTREEILSSLIDMISAAVDTTTTGIHWILCDLALNPDKQKILHNELKSIMAPDGNVDENQILQLHYLKAVIKESLRLHPVAFNLSRILENDIYIRGFHIPAKTVVSCNLIAQRFDEQLYRDARSYVPERWLRNHNHNIHPFANLVFSVGKRSCIGRRIAELEIQILIAKIVHKYSIRPADGADLQSEASHFLLVPASPLNLNLQLRK